MRFKINVKIKGADNETAWWENYDLPEVKTLEDATTTGKGYVEFFNSTLRPHEQAREFLGAEILGESDAHKWVKVSQTNVDHIGVYDRMQCEVCGVTGKRFGIQPNVKVDSKYRKHKRCAGKWVI